jgi:hypothetical protein
MESSTLLYQLKWTDPYLDYFCIFGAETMLSMKHDPYFLKDIFIVIKTN